MLDLIVKGGRVVTPQGVDVMDVGVQGDKIVAVGWPGTLAADAARVIDATGKIVVPGGIEPHAHIGIPVPEHWAGTPDVFTQPPEAASRAAAFGGVTTVIDFAGTLTLDPAKAVQRESMLDVLAARRAMFRGHSYTDFAFHYILAGEVPAATVGQIGEAIHDVPADPRAVRSPVEHLRRGGQAWRHHGRARRGGRRRHVHDGQAQGRGTGAGL
jgi:dihydropyrimidinase